MSEVRFTTGDPEKDFFEQNPHWRYLKSSQKLIKNYSSELVSKIRWCAFLLEDPDSKYHRYPKDKRVEIVNENYLKGVFIVEYDEERMKVINEDLDYVFDMYAAETMSKLKRDYYERELSYQLLVKQERSSNDLKIKADVQVKLAKIYDELKKAREEFEKENAEERIKSRGREQPGILFK